MTPNSSSIRRVKQNSQEKGKLKTYITEVPYLVIFLRRVLKLHCSVNPKEAKNFLYLIGY